MIGPSQLIAPLLVHSSPSTAFQTTLKSMLWMAFVKRRVLRPLKNTPASPSFCSTVTRAVTSEANVSSEENATKQREL